MCGGRLRERGSSDWPWRILNRSDFPTQQVSLVTAHLEDHPELETELNFGDDSVRDAFIGAGLGSVFGMLAGTSVAALAGGGVALLAGPLAGLGTGVMVVRCSGEWKVGEFTMHISTITKNSLTKGIRWLSLTESLCWSRNRTDC